MKRFSGISELTIAFALVFAVLAGTPIFARGTRAAGNGDGFIHVKVGYGTGPATGKFYGGETLEKNAWSDLYEKAGIKLDILFSDAPNYNEKLTQSIMAGDYPDVFYTRGGISQFKDFVEQGVIREIGTLFDQYGNANLKRFYSGEIQSMGLRSSTFNGKLYSLPMSGDPASNVYILWVRKDWLDKLGLQPPRTALQFYDVAKAFTEQDPDGNGQNDTYGFTFAGAASGNPGFIGAFFAMFGTWLDFGGEITFIDNGNSTVFGGANVDAMKKGLTMLHDMYSRGYIDKTIITNQAAQVNAAITAGKVGMVIGTHYTIGTPWADGLEINPNMEWIGVAMPGETEDKQGTMWYTAKPSNFNVCSSQFQNPEAFITMMNICADNYMFPDEVPYDTFIKLQGDGTTYTGFGLAPIYAVQPMKNYYTWFKIQDALNTGDTSKLNAEQMGYWNGMKMYLDHRGKPQGLNESDYALYKVGVYYNSMWGMKNCANEIIDRIFNAKNLMYNGFLGAPTEAMVRNTSTLQTALFEKIVNIVTGNDTVNSYDDFLRWWNANGGSQISADANSWYKANMGK